MKRVVVHIDRLALRGFRHEDCHAVAQGLREELGLLFAEPDAVRHLVSQGELSRVKVGRVSVGAEAKPYRVGTQTAKAIAREIK